MQRTKIKAAAGGVVIFPIIGNTYSMDRKPGRSPDLAHDELLNLEEQHEAMRIETLKALEALNNAKRHALFQLQKIQILFKYLSWKQQERISSHCDENFSLQKIHSLSSSFPAFSRSSEQPAAPAAIERTSSYLRRVKTARVNMVQFGIIQARTGELIAAIVKSVDVFNYQYKTAYRKLFPLGLFSKLWRSFRRFFAHPYFSWQEIGCLQNLGITAGLVLKMAEAPVLGVRP